MISAEELADYRLMKTEAMQDTCIIQDVDGNTLVTTKCLVRSSNRDERERVIAERLGVAITYTIECPYGIPIKVENRLVITSDDGKTRIFNVVAPIKGSYETSARCVCTCESEEV